MRISDWSSDVCSSDLREARMRRVRARLFARNKERPPGGGLSINSTADETSALQPLRNRRAQVARRLHRRHPSLLQRRELPLCRARATRSDRARMPHALALRRAGPGDRSEEHTSELQSLMRISYAVFCLKKKTPT